MADNLLLEGQLYYIFEELRVSQKEFSEALGINQPSVPAIKNRGNDSKIPIIKEHVEAMGGKLHINIELPTGKHIGFNV